VYFNLAVAVWGFGCFIVGIASNEASAKFGWKFAHVGGIFVGVFFYHVTCIFCELKRNKSIMTTYVIGIFYLFFTVMTDQVIDRTRFIFGLFYNDATWLFSIMISLWLFSVVWSFIELVRFFPKTKGIKRTQTKYIVLGFLTGFVGGISTFFPEFRIDILYPFGNFTIPIYCIIVTYAILRYRLMDINIVVKKTAVYSLSAGLLSGIFVIFVLTMTRLISNFAAISSFKISLIAAVLIALSFDPLRNRVQGLVDKVFYKKTYDYYAVIQHVSQTLSAVFNIQKIYSFVGDTIFSTLGLKDIYLLSAVTGRDYSVVYSRSFLSDERKMRREGGIAERDTDHLKVKENSEIIQLLKRSDNVVIKEELEGIREILGQKLIDDFKNTLKPFNGEAIIPVFIDDNLAIIIMLSEKLSGDVFTDQDIRLLDTIAHQTSIAVKNARLYSEKISSDRLASIGLMSATFAHEIRNPLTSIKTFAQLMPDKYTDAEFRENFSRLAVEEIGRIDRLIRDLMSFSSGNVTPPNTLIDLTGLVEETIGRLKTKLEMENSDIRVEKLFKNEKIRVVGDAQRLQQSFMNIMNNGCQAMGKNGILLIDINRNAQYVDVKIIDTGRGVAQEEVSNIFDPFYTTKPMGLGLGLAISKKIIEDHGGRVSVESKLSKGTTFTISIPVQDNPKGKENGADSLIK
jgi:signal transduction histidine kinase